MNLTGMNGFKLNDEVVAKHHRYTYYGRIVGFNVLHQSVTIVDKDSNESVHLLNTVSKVEKKPEFKVGDVVTFQGTIRRVVNPSTYLLGKAGDEHIWANIHDYIKVKPEEIELVERAPELPNPDKLYRENDKSGVYRYDEATDSFIIVWATGGMNVDREPIKRRSFGRWEQMEVIHDGS